MSPLYLRSPVQRTYALRSYETVFCLDQGRTPGIMSNEYVVNERICSRVQTLAISGQYVVRKRERPALIQTIYSRCAYHSKYLSRRKSIIDKVMYQSEEVLRSLPSFSTVIG
jgi:hypothetical protein